MIKTQEDFFNNICTSHFIARVRKGCVGFYCERELETEHNCNILTPHSYDRHVVSFLFSWCSTGGLGAPLLDASFLYCILSASSLDPKLHRGSRGPPRSGVAFPTTSLLQLAWHSTGNSTGPLGVELKLEPELNSTELYNRLTSTRSLKSNV